MVGLDDVSTAELRRALDDVEGKKPALRLASAIAYKNGVTQTELAEWFGVERRTIYDWLTRLDDHPVEQAVTDAERPGRPRKLSADHQARLEATLREPPSEAGYDASNWTPRLVRDHVRAEFDVDYSIPSCRRLMREAGLAYRTRGADDGQWVPR